MFYLDTLSTLVAATLVLLLGRKLVQSVSFLKKYTIPEPVAGGLLVAIALLVLKKSMGWEVNFDMTLRDPLMLAFFASATAASDSRFFLSVLSSPLCAIRRKGCASAVAANASRVAASQRIRLSISGMVSVSDRRYCFVQRATCRAK